MWNCLCDNACVPKAADTRLVQQLAFREQHDTTIATMHLGQRRQQVDLLSTPFPKRSPIAGWMNSSYHTVRLNLYKDEIM
jgi:hypothetical protein